MAKYADTAEGYKQFLEDYIARGQPIPEPPYPFPNPMTSVVLEPEIQGEILEDSFTALQTAECPDYLKFRISKEVVDKVLSGGIERFIDEDQEPEPEEHNQAGQGDNQGPPQNNTLYLTAEIANVTAQAVYDVCEEWNKEPPKFDIPNHNVYSIHGIKNTRRKMEDKHTVITDLNTVLGLKDVSPTQYYAVFDGHGGIDASLYASKQLHITLSRQETFKTDLEAALKKSILDLDNAYCKKADRDGSRSGTTAVATAIRDNFLYISWIGDSQGVLVRDGREFQLMEPHKPDRADEKKRIEDLGGCVIWFGAWRVNGTLSVSRAIGDPEFKPFVCGEADTSKAELVKDDDYLCIACDGFWDVFNGTQLAQMVSQHMKDGGDKKSLSTVLCEKAKDAGSSDNITVLIVFLKDVISEFKEDEAKTEEKVENADPENTNTESQNVKGNAVSEESNASEEAMVDEPDRVTDDSVAVQGSKLRPGVKERPPHRLIVNKPQSISSKVNILVTDTAPHARLPHSVITHKPHWQKSPVVERRDTRGSLFSLSTLESEEVTMPLSLGAENRLNIGGTQTQSGFPTIVHPLRERRPSLARNTPSPSVMSEPVMSGQTVISVHHPCKPAAQKDSTARRPYRTSIVMTQHFLDDGCDIGGVGYQRPKLLRRASRSVPDRLSQLSQLRQQGRASDSKSQKRFSPTSTRSFARQPRNGYHKENIVPHGMPYYSYFDTKIAITNSLHNKIKPKQSIQKRMRHSPQLPIHWHLSWIKN